MKYLDLENWERKNHFNYFKELDYPHFNICSNVDITEFYKYLKRHELPFFISFLYAAAETANSIKEFRYRIREEKVIEHEVVSPSFTVMGDNGLFGFCTAEFTRNYKNFKINSANAIEKIKKSVEIKDEPGRDDLLYITSIPWVSFTNITHPIHMKPVDCIPRISWGKYFEESGKIKLPLSVQVHHALVDGVHVGEYFIHIQTIMNEPEGYFTGSLV